MQTHPLGENGFHGRANQFNQANGKPQFHSTKTSEDMNKQAQEFWKTVNNYDQCLQYYKRFKPEYPEALQIASAQYMTNLVEKGKSSEKIEQISWDFMKEIQEIKDQLASSKNESRV